MTGDWPNDYDVNLNFCDYMSKPFSSDVIQQATQAALNKVSVFSESRSLRQSLDGTGGDFGLLLSKTPAMHQVFESIRMVAPTDMTVLLEGEAGTGKELVANAIHYQSSRRTGAFIPVNCAGFPDSLLETELFGCKEGGVFGTELKRPGKIKLADGGTLFLDEIEGMAPFVQSKFMQVLEDCNSVHLGGHQSLDSDIRVIAASNVPLQDLVAQGKMRPDLYYRINVVPIHILPLRERAGDIPILIDEFLRCHPIANQKRIVGVSHETVARLIQYQWPGNIRELQNVLEKAIILTRGSVIEVVDLPVVKTPVEQTK
jgi:DNA-binding NtrC family response regulator